MNEKELHEEKITKLEDFDTTTTNKKFKTITTIGTSLILVGAMILGGSLIAKIPNKNNNVPEPEPTSDSQEYGEDQNDNMFLELCEDFDINDKNAVNQRAKAIYELSEKQIKVEDIANMIYLINEKQELITLPSKDDVKNYEYLQSLIKDVKELLNDHMSSYVNTQQDLLEGNKDVNVTVKTLIQAYMFMAKTSVGKNTAISMAQVVNRQTDNIEQKNVDDMKAASEEYYKLYETLLETDGITNGENFVSLKDVQVKVSIMNVGLTKEQKDKMDNNKGSKYGELIGKDALIKLKIDDEEVIQNAHAYTTTPNGRSTGDADKAPRNGQDAPGEPSTEKGGKHVGTSSDASKVTTKKHSESSTVPVTEGKNDDGVEITTDKNGDGHGEVTEKGGEVVDETTKVSGGDIITEEESTTKEESTTNKTEPTTFVEEDVEDIPIYTDDEFDKENNKAAGIGSGIMGAGVLTLFSGKKRRRR